MINARKPAPFVLMSSNHGTLIVNRNDFRLTENGGYGVGFQLLNTSSFDQEEVNFVLSILMKRRVHFGHGVVAVDCGANIGVHTIEWARLMHDWGRVLSFEAQEKVFYALAGNVAINNCLNVVARHSAVGSVCGMIEVPEPNYLIPSSYGSLELKQGPTNEYIGQEIDYAKTQQVPIVTIDSLNLDRLDFLKIDVEGMEEDVLAGAAKSIERHKPIMLIEIIKSDRQGIGTFLDAIGYRTWPAGINILATHASDPITECLRFDNNALRLS